MDELFLRLLCRMVEIGVILSFRVTKDKVYIIIKNNRPRSWRLRVAVIC